MNRSLVFLFLFLATPGVWVPARADWQDTYSALLQRHAKPQGVDYRSWAMSRADLNRLQGVVDAIGSEAPSGTRNQRLAWYLNAYNALVVHKLLRAYPSDLRDESARLRFFRSKDLQVGGEELSLEELEQRVICRTYRDSRVHFALCKGTVGSPSLWNRAYNAATLNADLTARTRDFLLEHPDGVRVSGDGKSIAVSELFAWHREDFDGGDVKRFISRHRGIPLPEGVELTFLTHDWSRNDSGRR